MRSCCWRPATCKHVELIEVAQINPLSLLDHERVLMTVGAVKLLEERFQ